MIPESWWNLFGFLSWLHETDEEDGEEDPGPDGEDSLDEARDEEE